MTSSLKKGNVRGVETINRLAFGEEMLDKRSYTVHEYCSKVTTDDDYNAIITSGLVID